MKSDWRDELFEETTLWSLYRRALRMNDTTLNRVLRWGTFFALCAFVLGNEFVLNRSLLSLEALRDSIRSWSADGISFATSLLGFLVAGFTIFATLTKPEVFIKLATTPYKKTGLSQLKFVFFNFMLVFIHYVCFLALCIVIKTFFGADTPGNAILKEVSLKIPAVRPVIINFGIVLVGTWMIVLIVLLKSFIWNVYQSVLIAIVVETILPGQSQTATKK